MKSDGVPESYRELLLFMVRHSGPWALLIMIVCAAIWKSLWGAWGLADLMIILAFVALRGFMEWAVHAWLYHARPLPIIGTRLLGPIHEAHVAHHVNPRNFETFMITWRGVLVASTAFWLFVWAITGSINLAWSGVLGIALLGVWTEVVHLIAHCRIYPKNAFLRRLVTLHRMHHWTHGEQVFGVSSTLADRLMGTYPQRRSGRT